MKKIIIFSTLTCLSIFLGALAFNPLPQYETHWDWDAIFKTTQNVSYEAVSNLKSIKYWGTGDSDLQTSGMESSGKYPIKNNWTVWQERIDKNGQPIVPQEKRIGTATGSWQGFGKDITCLKQLGANIHRFSIEWSKIEPQKGVFDHEAMQRYVDYANALIANGIKPIPTLFHHSWPLWFEYVGDPERGFAFEDEKNIPDFVDYTRYVFKAMMNGVSNPHQLDIWLTINEPVAYAMGAYISGDVPPGKKGCIRMCGRVVKNFLDAHCAIYDMMHQENNHKVALQISFPKLFQPIQPYYPLNPIDQMVTKFFNYLIHTPTLEYFRTGRFYWPGLGTSINEQAPHKLDFIGVNYYSNTLLSTLHFLNPIKARPGQTIAEGTDLRHEPPRTLYAEGFYESIMLANTLGKPLWITENGFPTDSLEKREEYFKKHFYALSKAISEGVIINGYIWWSLVDNYEWNAGIGRYGLFDFQRTLKPNAGYFVDLLRFIKS